MRIIWLGKNYCTIKMETKYINQVSASLTFSTSMNNGTHILPPEGKEENKNKVRKGERDREKGQ